jgi:hypothetical protein
VQACSEHIGEIQMTFDIGLTEPSDERVIAVEELQSKTLVSPVSGLASDYLNLFNELVIMLEQIPAMPELFEDLCAWRPVSYEEYFRKSQLPGRHSALAAYQELGPTFRRRFETFVAELDVVALASVASVRRQLRDGPPQDMERLKETCARAGEKMRVILLRASRLVNYANLEG